MRKYLNPGCTRFQVNKGLFAGKEKELIEYVSGKINTKEKRICIAYPDGSGKSDLLNLLAVYYEDGNSFDYLFDYKDDHYGKYDVIKISLRDILEKNPIDSWPIEKMYFELLDEIKREYKRIRFEKEDALSDVLRKIYECTHRQFMIFIDDFDLVALNGRRYERNIDHYIWYMSELVPKENDSHIALAYISGVMPVRSSFIARYLKKFKEYTIYNPNILTDALRKDTHSNDVAHIKFLINWNVQLIRKYIVPLISGVRVPVNLDKHLYQVVGERPALAQLSYMGVIRYENHTVYLEDEKMRIYLLNSINQKDMEKYLATKNVFEEEYILDEKMDKYEILNDVLVHNFSLSFKYKLPLVEYNDDSAVIIYHPRDEYRNTEKIKQVYLISADSLQNISSENKEAVVIRL